MTRDERQEDCIKNWIANKGLGTISACTGFGKTRIAINIIKRTILNNVNSKILIVVPTNYLKISWEKEISNLLIPPTCLIKVGIINSVIREINQSYDLLIADEAHRYATSIDNKTNNSFVNLFDKKYVKFKWFLGLTATEIRQDGWQKTLLEIAPVIDKVTLEEATKNKWVSKYNEFVFHINLNKDDKKKYDALNNIYNKLYPKYEFNYNNVAKCLTIQGAVNYYFNTYSTPIEKANFSLVNKKHPEVIGLLRSAIELSSIISKRKLILYNHEEKLNKTKEILSFIINNTTEQFICFSESIDFCEKLYSEFKNETIIYHSKIKGKTVIINSKEVKLSKEEYKKHQIGLISSKEKQGIITPRSLDEGADLPNLSIGIISSYTSAIRQNIQRTGRVIRTNTDKPDKKALIIHIVTKQTQEEVWFNRSTAGRNIKEFYTVEELNYLLKIYGIFKP